MSNRVLSCVALLVLTTVACAQNTFVNWESAHVNPLDVTPDGVRLVAVNTPDNRVEVFRIGPGGDLVSIGSVPVGLGPVSARARTTREIWVANRVSDSVSIVDLETWSVAATIRVDDEPGDIVFAGGKAFISMGTSNEIWVYDTPYDPTAAPAIVTIEGETPRSLATDGTTVHALILEGGNRTGVLNHAFLCDPAVNPYPGQPSPPPNAGDGFDPPLNPDLPTPPASSMILQQDEAGVWRDDQGTEWAGTAPWWTLHGNSIAHVDVATLTVTYTDDLLTTNAALALNSVDGRVAVVGTHARNVIRFEPNLRGRFLTVGAAFIDPDNEGPVHVALNPHLAEFFPEGDPGGLGAPAIEILPLEIRRQTLGDPQGVAWSPDGTFALVTGRGSNSIVKIGPDGVRLGLLEVGQGPTGVVFGADTGRAYVINKFEASISVVNANTLVERSRATFHDPTPSAIRTGRPHFYDTVKSSGLGQASCESCHKNGAMDNLAWDLGDPSGDMKEFNQVCLGGGPGCDDTDWHPMKGPMTTQTLFGTIGTEPFHWRGDREDLAAFNPAFDSLLAGPLLSDEEMAEFEAFVATLRFPPNPFRERDNDLAAVLPNGGDPAQGKFLFDTQPMGGSAMLMGESGHVSLVPPAGGTLGGPLGGGGGLGCAGCHAGAEGSNFEILRDLPAACAVTGIEHLTKVAQLRNLYRKDGFDVAINGPLSRGTGFLHDGSFDTLDNFMLFFFGGVTTAQDRLDVVAYLQSFAVDTHAGVGAQATVDGANAGETMLRDELVTIADGGEVALVAKGVYHEEVRGFAYLGDQAFQSDRVDELVSLSELDASVAPGFEITYTLVTLGSETRIGVDRDEDGFFDRDELDACADPADPTSFPGSGSCCGDVDGGGAVDFQDLLAVLAAWGPCPGCPEDFDLNGFVDFVDLLTVLANWGDCP